MGRTRWGVTWADGSSVPQEATWIYPLWSVTALSVQVFPGKPEKIHRVGTVAAYSEGESITLLAVDGNEYTFAVAAEAKILPAEWGTNWRWVRASSSSHGAM